MKYIEQNQKINANVNVKNINYKLLTTSKMLDNLLNFCNHVNFLKQKVKLIYNSGNYDNFFPYNIAKF